MESIHQFEMILLSRTEAALPSKCSINEEYDNFANEIFNQSLDEFSLSGVNFLPELDKDEKMYLDELQSITDKIDLPLYDYVESTDNARHYASGVNKNLKTEQLLMEFDSIYDELSHLTPPQTPPEQPEFVQPAIHHEVQFQNIPDGQFIFNYQQHETPVQEQFIYIQNDVPSPTEQYEIIYENSNQSAMSCEEVSQHELIIDPEPIINSPTDIARELEVVNELVLSAHSRAQSDYDDDASTVITSSSWSPRSEYSSTYSQDDEPKKSSSGLRGVTKKRSRGYGRNPEDKKVRKKEQNKNAATRYRQKKKQEVEVILDEERIMHDKNRKLMTTYKDVRREVKYLKSLLRELFNARGFIQ